MDMSDTCLKCGSELIKKDTLGYWKICPKCDKELVGKPTPSPRRLYSQPATSPTVSTKPIPPTTVKISVTKPAPPVKKIIPYLEQIGEYRNASPNKSQREIITKIEDCIKNNKTRIIISAPTGCGKSWIATTLLSAYGGVVLTSTNDLQDQYCGTEQGLDDEKKPGDFDFMNSIRGKKRYPCELSENTITCDEAYCPGCEFKPKRDDIQVARISELKESIRKPEGPLCEYYKSDEIGKKSNFSVYSYASYITRMKADQLKKEKQDKLPDKAVLICDEAHDYDRVVSDLLTVELDGDLNKRITGKSLPNFDDLVTEVEKIEKTREFIEEIVAKFEQSIDEIKDCAEHARILKSKKHLEMHEDLKCKIHNFKCDVKCELCQPMKKFLDGKCLECEEHLKIIDDCSLDHSTVLKDINRYTLYIQDLKFILPGLTLYPDNYLITKQESNKFSITPWQTTWFTKKILEKFNLCIFMSATINRTILSKETGIAENEFEFIDQPSEIPEKNRQIKFLNSYSYKNETDWNVVIDKIKEIFDKHSGQRGLILCTAYKQMDEIQRGMEERYPADFMRLTFDVKARKFKDTISENNEKPNGVIISAKAGTGIDLKDDLSRFQIIIKAPYMSELQDQNDKRAAKIKEFDLPRFFMKSLFRLVQFAGRSVRGITDYAETYVLDTAGLYMVKSGYSRREYVPVWFFNACDFDAKL